MNTPKDANESERRIILRGRIEKFILYEVMEHELAFFERGLPATIQLNFAVFLFSLAFTSIVALCTANFRWAIAQTAFLLVAIVGILLGVYLLLCWRKTRTSIAAVIKAIRERIEVPTGRRHVP